MSRHLNTHIDLGVTPVVNENDTVATEEIRYGDNDRLAARVAQMIGADLLVLLSDVDGLYTADPRKDPSARHVPVISDLTHEIEAMAGGSNAEAGVGTGGMATKLTAARIAQGAGCATLITLAWPRPPLQAAGPASDPGEPHESSGGLQVWIAGSLELGRHRRRRCGAALRAGRACWRRVRAVDGADKGDAVRRDRAASRSAHAFR